MCTSSRTKRINLKNRNVTGIGNDYEGREIRRAAGVFHENSIICTVINSLTPTSVSLSARLRKSTYASIIYRPIYALASSFHFYAFLFMILFFYQGLTLSHLLTRTNASYSTRIVRQRVVLVLILRYLSNLTMNDISFVSAVHVHLLGRELLLLRINLLANENIFS